jgi:glucoamylase
MNRRLAYLTTIFGMGMSLVLPGFASPAIEPPPGAALQYDRAIRGVLANLQPSGAVIASPSRSEPNYAFNWVRDTALTMKALIELAYDPTTGADLKKVLLEKIDRWLIWEEGVQEQDQLTGLGEPRFNLDGTPNLDAWGRPQNDGPALRALAVIRIAKEWIRNGRMMEVRSRLYAPVLPAKSLIKRDLEYVAHHWRDQSVDLWEEERALHYYTLLAQRTALLRGAALADQLDDPGAARFYRTEAGGIESLLGSFYDPASGIVRYAIEKTSGLPHKTGPLDIAVILATIQTFQDQFEVPVKPIVATLRALMTEFIDRYPLNQNRSEMRNQNLGIALGRYPEDLYDGVGFSCGNPWFLSTLAAAELACDLGRTGDYPPGLVQSLAIPQFNRVLHHLNASGDMNEQFNRSTGFEQGARHLTWSYTAYLTAYRSCFLRR